MLSKTPHRRPRVDPRDRGFKRQLSAAVSGVVLGAALVWAAADASAQSLGTPRDLSTRTEIADYLGQAYDEAPVAGGIASNGSVLEVFSSPDGNSWTIVLTSPDGTSQVMAAGETWLELLKLKGELI